MSVTLRQKELVQDTCERVAPDSEMAARLFYGRLFEIDPQLRALLPAEKGKMEEQSRKLMQMNSPGQPPHGERDEIGPAEEDLAVGPSLTAYTRGLQPRGRIAPIRWSRARASRPGLQSTLCWTVYCRT